MPGKRRLAPLASVLAVAAAAALAQNPPKPLTLDDCIRMALAAPSAVTVARQEAEIARLGVSVARAGFLPQTYVANDFTYNSPQPGTDQLSFIALNGIREYASQLTVAADLDTSGRLRAVLARARADRDAARAGAGIAERDLKRAVRTAYFQVLLARRLVSANEQSLVEARSFEARTRLLAGAGEVAQADVVKAAAQVAFLEQSQRASELDAALASHELASFWTEDVAAPLVLEDVLDRVEPPPSPAQPAARPFFGRPEFRLFEAQRQGFLADARGARAQLFPQLSAVFQYGVDSLRFSFHDRGYAAFLNLNIPVFDWFRARNQYRQFHLRAEQTEANRAVATRGFSRAYENALVRVKLIYGQVTAAGAQVKLSDDNLRLSRLRYEGGEGPALDVIAAQTQLTQARANRYGAIAAYLNARADLEVASGR